MKIAVKKRCEALGELTGALTGLEKLERFFAPGEYRITVERVDREHTGEQLRFYWAVLNDIALQTGQEAEDLHEHFKARFLQDRSIRPSRIRSTTELSVLEFIRYIDQILSYMANEVGITVRNTREF